MALNAAIVWEVQTGGSDNSGGGFKAGATGTDRSQQTAAQATLTAASVIHSTTTQINVAVGDFTVSAADVGNVLQVTGGTATAGFYEITAADVPNNRWTVDRSVGTAAQTVVGAMGGCLATPGKAAGAKVASNSVWIKAGTYTLTSASSNVAGGTVLDSTGGSGTAPSFWRAYTSTRGDNTGTASIVVPNSGAITTVTVFSVTGQAVFIHGVTVDGNTQTSIRGIDFTNVIGGVFRCVAKNCTNVGIRASASNAISVVACGATGCTTTAPAISVGGAGAYNCEAWGNSVSGFFGTAETPIVGCISRGNTGASSDGFAGSAARVQFVSCSAYGNGRDGFSFIQSGGLALNCIAEANSQYGANVQGGADGRPLLVNFATYNNTSGATNNLSAGVSVGSIVGSGSFFTNAASGDLSLNTTAGAGSLVRATAYPATYAAGLTSTYRDIGAAQHADPPQFLGGIFGG